MQHNGTFQMVRSHLAPNLKRFFKWNQLLHSSEAATRLQKLSALAGKASLDFPSKVYRWSCRPLPCLQKPRSILMADWWSQSQVPTGTRFRLPGTAAPPGSSFKAAISASQMLPSLGTSKRNANGGSEFMNSHCQLEDKKKPDGAKVINILFLLTHVTSKTIQFILIILSSYNQNIIHYDSFTGSNII